MRLLTDRGRGAGGRLRKAAGRARFSGHAMVIIRAQNWIRIIREGRDGGMDTAAKR